MSHEPATNPPTIPSAAGGWHSIFYTLRAARRVGGLRRMWGALRSRNACKTCALGMGGQRGGMVNEAGRFPEVCKKSVQAMAGDMQGRIRAGFFDEFSFGKLERFSPRELETAGRLTEPLHAGPNDKGYRTITWDEAISRIAAVMRTSRPTPDDTFFYFSGRSSNEAGFLLQVFARLFGTNNVNNCSYFCHQASGVALTSVLGTGTATVTLEDVEHADFVMLLGANPASNHPRLMRSLMEVVRRGGQVVAVNPIREIGLVNFKVPSDARSLLLGSRVSTEFVQPHIGGDLAFMYGVAKSLIERGAVDEGFLASHADRWPELRAAASQADWRDLVERSGVTREQMEHVAELYARAKTAVFCWTMGMTHHAHGVDNVRMIANLALMRGMVGRPGAGLLPLRGHSNVQGIGSMGATPALKEQVLVALRDRFGIAAPPGKGLDTLACIERAAEGRVRFAWHLGGNLFGSAPDATVARAALRKIGTTVFLSTSLNTGHIHGRGVESIVLPVRARDEEPEPTTQESMFNYVRISDGGPSRFGHADTGPRGEVQVIAAVARAVLGQSSPIDFTALEHHADIRRMIAEVIPGYAPIAEVDRTREEFYVGGRLVREPSFATANKRATMFAPALPDLGRAAAGADGGELMLMTIRSEGQFNTVVYEEEDVYRGQERRDVILMNPANIARLKLKVNDRVRVSSPVGSMDDVLVRAIDIRPGNAAMYYPEANVLVPRRVDPESRTPAFKSVRVRVERARVGLPVVGG